MNSHMIDIMGEVMPNEPYAINKRLEAWVEEVEFIRSEQHHLDQKLVKALSMVRRLHEALARHGGTA